MKDTSTKKATFRAVPSSSPEGASCEVIDPRTRHELIARAAYFRAEDRGFTPRHEQEDWYAAELEIDTVLNRGNQLYATA